MATNSGYARRKIRELRLRFLRRYWWLLALFAIFVVGCSFALAWFENLVNRWVDPSAVTGFILGVGATAAAAMVITLMGMDGSRSYRDGLEAESWTAQALDRLRKHGWHVVHDLEFEHHNIDHVLVGPRGAIAVETKLRNEEWTITPTSIEDAHHRPVRWTGSLVGQAGRQARTLRSLLFAGGVRTDVLPVLILWGRGITGMSTVNIDGVLVGLGKNIKHWVSDLSSTPLSEQQVELARRTVERFKAGEGARRPHLAPMPAAPSGLPEQPAHSMSSVSQEQTEPVSIARR